MGDVNARFFVPFTALDYCLGTLDIRRTMEYTHIVVGAGSAGCVVAARIAENGAFHVLLIEAGPDSDDKDQDMPGGIQDARRVPMKGQSKVYDPRMDWNLSVELPGLETMVVPQAKVMGGGSSINGGTALRSTVNDSKEWVELGNYAWDFESVYAVYENLENDELRGTHGLHPIVRTMPGQAGKIQKAFLEGATATGFRRVLDFNETGAEGVGPSPVCRQGDRRISSANTFIDPIRGQDNITILTDTLVDKILFSGTRACEVLLSGGQRILATHEIIISAGAIFSPAILQRSGVGRSSFLNCLGISTVADLPVGENLSDHPCIPVVAKPRNGAYLEGDYSLQMQARWSSSFTPNAIDHQLVCFSYLFAESPDPRVQQRGLAGTATGHVAGVGGNLNKPTSLGTVKIKSKDPQQHPTVNPNYLQTSHDRRSMRELVRRAYRVITSAPMQSAVGLPLGLDDQTIENDALLDMWITSQLSTTYHFCGSSRMAHQDCGGVVDQSGRVYGVQGLRVCDASILPTVPASNTMWTTMMFAERIGSSIRDRKEVSKKKLPKAHSRL